MYQVMFDGSSICSCCGAHTTSRCNNIRPDGIHITQKETTTSDLFNARGTTVKRKKVTTKNGDYHVTWLEYHNA